MDDSKASWLASCWAAEKAVWKESLWAGATVALWVLCWAAEKGSLLVGWMAWRKDKKVAAPLVFHSADLKAALMAVRRADRWVARTEFCWES